jgi:hypothetical protein
MPWGCRLRLNSLTKIVSPLSYVTAQVRLGRYNRRSDAWILTGDSSSWRFNLLQEHVDAGT